MQKQDTTQTDNRGPIDCALLTSKYLMIVMRLPWSSANPSQLSPISEPSRRLKFYGVAK